MMNLNGAYVINLDDKNSKEKHWVQLFIDRKIAIYFDSFWIKYIPKEVLNRIKDRSITHNIFRIQDHESIMCGISCIVFIEYTQCTHPCRFAINSTSKLHVGSFSRFHRFWIQVEIITLIWRGNFNVDSTFKIDKISMSFPRGIFYVVSMSNRLNFFTRCFLSIILEHFLL